MSNQPPSFKSVAILGVGLLGGSIGLALRRAGFAGRITGFGHRQSSMDAAVSAGAIDAGYLDLAPAVRDADLVILASPVGLFLPLLGELCELVRPDAIVTDVGSTKRQVVSWAKMLLPRGVRFVGSHPIAGSDKRGVQYARPDLFDNACCVLTPVPNAKSKGSGIRNKGSAIPNSYADAVSLVDAFWQSLGMWTVRMTPAQHDRCLAQISHLPHAAAAALVLLSSPRCPGPGWRRVPGQHANRRRRPGTVARHLPDQRRRGRPGDRGPGPQAAATRSPDRHRRWPRPGAFPG